MKPVVFFNSLAEKSGAVMPRGDYSTASDDYVVAQQWDVYTAEQHALWRRLYQRQAKLLPGRACDSYVEHLAHIDAAEGIPNLAAVSEALFRATGWRLVAVPGLVPDKVFFAHLAARRFPVTVWLRTPEEFDYIVEPDIFHDFFGHVPLLFDPVFAAHLQEYGKGGLKALTLGGLDFLARLYWYTMEFGLVKSSKGLRAYGAGILSSVGELDYCLNDQAPHRIRFELERVMRTRYKIDAYQKTYFVIDDFQQLFDDTTPDFTLLYQRLKTLSALSADSLLPGETNLSLANASLDDDG